MNVRDAIPRGWLDSLKSGPIGVGMDIATTDGPHSNPASITVAELFGGMLYERLVISWKTRDEAVARLMLATVLGDLKSLERRPRNTSLDASNEVFFAQRLAKDLRELSPFRLVKGGENVTYQGQTLRAKEMLGNLYVNAYTDGIIASPEAPFLKEDRRLVRRSKGLFTTMTGKGGKHGDTFDSGKLAYWSLLQGGEIEVAAVSITGGSGNKAWDRSAEDEDETDSTLNRCLAC